MSGSCVGRLFFKRPFQGVLPGFKGSPDYLGRMHGRGIHASSGHEKDALNQAFCVPGAKKDFVILQRIAIGAQDGQFCEMDGECSAESRGANGNAQPAARCLNSVHQLFSASHGVVEWTAIVARKFAKSSVRAGETQTVPVKCAAEDDPAIRNLVEDLSPSSDDAQRQAAGDGFAKCCNIRRNTQDALCSAQSDAEASDDFIEDQESLVLRGEQPKLLQVSFVRHQAAAIAQYGLGDDRSDLIALSSEDSSHGVKVVPGKNDYVVDDIYRLALRTKNGSR